MKEVLLICYLLACIPLYSQSLIPIIDTLDLDAIEPNTQKKFWLKMIDNGMSQPISIPIIVAKGKSTHPVLGLTAAIHGNEVNGIPIIHQVMSQTDLDALDGTIIAIPGLNAISLPLHQRRYIDREDLNRNFPGKAKGNRSQQYVWNINQKILTQLDYLIDMHTASFGRENTLYVRADLSDEKIAKMAFLQDADIILNNKGIPSTNEQIAATRTMRAEAMLKGIPTITIEYGNPQVYQASMTQRGIVGIKNVISWLNMTADEVQEVPKAIVCKKSFWIYVDRGGYLEVPVALNQQLKEREIIGVLRNPFGEIIQTYYCPQEGIVIGKSSNPINMDGGRIIHLGILDETKN